MLVNLARVVRRSEEGQSRRNTRWLSTEKGVEARVIRFDPEQQELHFKPVSASATNGRATRACPARWIYKTELVNPFPLFLMQRKDGWRGLDFGGLNSGGGRIIGEGDVAGREIPYARVVSST